MLKGVQVRVIALAIAAVAAHAGELVKHPAFASKHLATPRDLIVYLPAGYREGAARYPIFYMHDGQNLFDPATAFAHNEWRVDEVADELIAARKIPPLIIV